MGMVVRTNMAGLNANNALNAASKTQQNAMQKLASGFRINKAADDASGLAISEKMKNQIKALDTAADNCEDGANMIQTAEGYMNETHDILNRMTELAEKAANGVLDDTDRDALQDEMNELCGEIDRMATTANFNGHKLMDGSIGSTDSLKLDCDTTSKKIVYTAPEFNSVRTEATVDGVNFKITDNAGNAFALDTGTYKVKADGKLYDSAGNAVKDSDNNDLTVTFGPVVGTKVQLTGTNGVEIKDTKAASNVIGTVKSTSNTNTNEVEYRSDGKWYDIATNAEDTTVSFTPAAALAEEYEFTIKEGINLQIGESSTSADRLEVTINSFHTDALFGGLDGFVNKTNDNTDNAATAAVKIIKPTAENGQEANKASTYKNAVTIDISNKDNASAAADAIRQVSNYVSDERGRLGAQQNRLEHTVNNLTTASENTTAANSRIRDTNMAEEMMSYTSKNVVAQAAQAMLAQANSQPQNVLSLLQ